MNKNKSGETIILIQAILWSLFPVLTKFTLVAHPLVSLAWSTALGSLVFIVLGLLKKSWTNLFKKDLFPHLLSSALIAGVLFPALLFLGLKYTTPGNMGIILTFEILFTYLFFNIWKKEFISAKHLVGIALMFASAVVILSPNLHSFQKGDLLIFFAVALPPAANYFQKKAREKISSEQILLSRALFSLPILLILIYVFGSSISLPQSTPLIALLINGVVMFGLVKIMWLEGIHRISVTKAISLSSVAPVFTLIFSYLLMGNAPSMLQLFAMPLSIIGVYLLTT